MLLKLQAELGAASPLRAAVSVCAPIRLDLCADRIRQGFSRLYQAHLLRRMKRNLLIKYPLHDYQTLIGLSKTDIRGLNDFWSFDDAYTAPMHGFKNVYDYYDRSSARQYLGDIQQPALILHARDDPFMLPEVIPEISELSSRVELELSEHGGHVGFVSGSLLRPIYWLPERISTYLADYLD
jgi:predicted alpha/beta-fold hydrolase